MQHVYSSIPEQKIGKNSSLEVHYDYIRLKVKKPTWPYIAALVLSPFVYLGFIYWTIYSDPEMTDLLIIVCPCMYVIQIAATFYHTSLEDHYDLNMTKRKVITER